MRYALGILLFGVLGLLGSSAWWFQAAAPAVVPDPARTEQLLADFVAQESAEVVVVDLAARYSGREELLDPAAALPSWHRVPRDQAQAVYRATRSCPPAPIAGELEPALAKALRWHAATCATPRTNADDLAPLVDHAPYLHPSGRSYAALTLARTELDAPARRAFVRAHERSFHVTELGALAREELPPESRSLAGWPLAAWEALGRGDALWMTPESLVLRDGSALGGVGRFRSYPRGPWEALASARGLALARRSPTTTCEHPATPALCWESRGAGPRSRELLAATTSSSAVLVVFAMALLALFRVRERRRADADRLYVLRTLTHELRTPATSLGLDIEPLRAAYDALPLSCQEPVLRLSDGIERLTRVLHRSARYLALFETPTTEQARLTRISDIESLRAFFDDCAAEWPETVQLVHPATDGSFATDAEWIGVALRNLVENAVRHGRPPVTVSWRRDGGELVVRVIDGGATPDFRLAAASAAHARGKDSEGLGLGLAIVQRAAALLGGTLSHAPLPTTFELRLPAGGRSQ